ncbi:MAG: hypothetical protein RIS88_2308, partial [Pseudomonadota bacterium]
TGFSQSQACMGASSEQAKVLMIGSGSLRRVSPQ